MAEALKANLEKDGTPAVILHMNKQVGLYGTSGTFATHCSASYARRNRSRIQHLSLARAAPVPGRAKAMLLEICYRIIWNKELRRWVDLGDLATFLVYRLYVEKVRGQVLIMDRYFYDRITDIADGRHWRYLRWSRASRRCRTCRSSWRSVPEDAFARKGEYSVDSMTVRRANYQKVFRLGARRHHPVQR